MHPRVERLPQPDPDYRRFLKVLRRERPDRVPLIELAVHPEVVNALLGEPVPATGDARQDLKAAIQRNVRLHHRLGYDVVKVSAPIPWDVQRLAGTDPSTLSSNTRQWTDEHRGPIGSSTDFDSFHWPTQNDIDFEPLLWAAQVLPTGMKLIGFSGGVLEFAMDLMGMERLMIASRREPELVAAVIDRVGPTIHGVFEAYCRMDAVCAVWLGDDLGHKHGLLVSPQLLRTHVFPWYRRFAELAHAHGRPFLLHSCGQTASIMPDLVENAGIDAKHSFEDGIESVEQFYDRWAGKVAVLGGVDVHLLSVGDEAAIKDRVRAILKHCAGNERGGVNAAPAGYAAGSGNSIPNYVPPEHYLAMIEAVVEYNSR